MKVLRDELESGPCAALSKPQHMARAANRLRQNSRPEDPKDVQFLLAENCIPTDFLQEDINEAGRYQRSRQTSLDFCKERTASHPVPSTNMVRGWHVQARASPIYPVAHHKCVCEIRRPYKASTTYLRFNVGKKNQRSQEGKDSTIVLCLKALVIFFGCRKAFTKFHASCCHGSVHFQALQLVYPYSF